MAKRWVDWSERQEATLRCGYCCGDLGTPYAIIHVEDEHNKFRLTVCDQCGRLAEALFANGRDFPGLELK